MSVLFLYTHYVMHLFGLIGFAGILKARELEVDWFQSIWASEYSFEEDDIDSDGVVSWFECSLPKARWLFFVVVCLSLRFRSQGRLTLIPAFVIVDLCSGWGQSTRSGWDDGR